MAINRPILVCSYIYAPVYVCFAANLACSVGPTETEADKAKGRAWCAVRACAFVSPAGHGLAIAQAQAQRREDMSRSRAVVLAWHGLVSASLLSDHCRGDMCLPPEQDARRVDLAMGAVHHACALLDNAPAGRGRRGHATV